jgi:AcrR family transcriptional regulator
MIMDSVSENAMDGTKMVSAIGRWLPPSPGKPAMAEMDRRAARTRRALHQALMKLILRKGYEAITVQDIVGEADVGRSTFYAHYTGKEDMLRSGFASLRAELIGARRAPRQGAAATAGESLGFSLALFEHAAGYADVFRALVGGRGGSVAVGEIRQVLSELVHMDLPAPQNDDGVPREVVVQFVVSAFLTLLSWWLERKPGLTPLQVDAMFRRLVLDGIGRQIGTAPG